MTLDLSRRAELFLFHEAQLLDDWDLDAWIQLFHPDGRYEVPAISRPLGTADDSQMLISDDHERLTARVQRLASPNAHAEHPRSRLCRIVSNVQARLDGDVVHVTANVVVWRFRLGDADHYVVRYRHELVDRDGSFQFKLRRVELIQEALTPGGRLSFVL